MLSGSHLNRLLEACRQVHSTGRTIDYLRVAGGDAELAEELERRIIGDTYLSAVSGAPQSPTESPVDDHPSSVDGVELPPRFGDHQLIRPLGQGGMGAVFLAQDSQLARQVALKTLRPELAVSRELRERFLREARATAALQHDNIVPIFHVGEQGGLPYITMPLLRGEPLNERLRSGRSLPIDEAIRIGRETADGLSAAHDAGVIHRDIKPANIWLEAPKDRVRILDFGLARQVEATGDQLTKLGAVVGTPSYMAPEQARGKAVDHRADLFSLGCVLYELTTGRKPFPGPDSVSILMAVAYDTPVPPIVANSEVPPDLSRLILHLLEKNPADRPSSAREVVDQLTRIGLGLPAEVIPLAEEASGIASLKGGGEDPWSAIDLPTDSTGTDVRLPSIIGPATATMTLPTQPRFPWVFVVIPAAIVVMTMVVWLMMPNRGTVAVVCDQEARFVVVKDGKVVARVSSAESVRLRPGKYTVEIEEGPPNLELRKDRFEISAGVTETIHAVIVTPKGPSKVVPSNVVSEPESIAVLWNRPSILDQLEHSEIPESESLPKSHPEIVALIGTSGFRHWGSVDEVTLLPGTNRIVSMSKTDTAVRIWDGAQGKQIAELPSRNHARRWCIAVTPDGKTLFGAVDGGIEIWSIDGPPKFLKMHGQSSRPIRCMVVSSDGGQLWTAVDRQLFVFDWDGRELRQRSRLGELRDEPCAMEASTIPGDSSIATIDRLSNVRLYGLKDGKPEILKSRKAAEWDGNSVQRLPGTDLLIARTDGASLRIVDFEQTSRPMETLHSRDARNITAFRCAPDGKKIYVGTENGYLRKFELRGAKWEETAEYSAGFEPISAMTLSRDGMHLVTGDGRGRVRQWKIGEWPPMEESPSTSPKMLTTESTMFSLNRQQGSITVLRRDGRGEVVELTRRDPRVRHTLWTSGLGYLAPQWLPDGKTLAVGTSDRTRLTTIRDGRPADLGDPLAARGTLSFSKAGTAMSVVNGGPSVAIFQRTGDRWTPAGSISVSASAGTLSPDGMMIALVVRNGRQMQFWKRTVSGWVPAGEVSALSNFGGRPSFTPHGRTVHIADGGISQVDLKEPHLTAVKLFERKGDAPGFSELALSPSGRLHAASSPYGHVVLSDAVTGQTLREWYLPGQVRQLEFFDDRYLVMGHADGTVAIVRLSAAKR